MKMTLRQRYTAALILMGEQRVKQTRHYDVFSCRNGGFYYLGSHGAVRFGPTATKSIPCSEQFLRHLEGCLT